MKEKMIQISIAFGNVMLPVIECEDGHDRVPMRQISDEIGLSWPAQARKVEEGKYLNKRLGVQIRSLKATDKDENDGKLKQICLRVDRVEAFLNTINPENVRGMGNDESADWLEAKHREWDDALHEYETSGVVMNRNKEHIDVISVIAQIDRIKNPTLKQIAAAKANEAFGLNIQIGEQGNLPIQ